MIDLGGRDWEFGSVEPGPRDDDYERVREWRPASVPGGLHADLAALNLISDPYVSDNLETSRWVEERDWWYRKSFRRPSDARRVFLVCLGIDYRSTVYVNGRRLGQHEGMFSTQSYELTDLLETENLLAVRISGARSLPRLKRSLRDRLEQILARALFQAELYPERFASLKCQMSYGWDFAPRLPNLGLWDDVLLATSGDVWIRRVRIGATPIDNQARLDVALDLDARVASTVVACVQILATNGDIIVEQPFPLALPDGPSTHRFHLFLDQPTLWQPWDRGEPCLQRARVILEHQGEQLDVAEESFGVRSVELVRGKGRWSLRVNGEEEYLRGTNWVPADAIYGRVQAEDYERLIAQAKQANVNVLRVWGGGLREKRAFYEQCDRQGMLVWQEFPFACAFFDRFPSDQTHARLVEQEARSMVDRLYNHPSVALWCGGNEFNPRRNRHIVDNLSLALRYHGDSRPFVPASPGGGDAHNWRVWHGQANLGDYRRERAPLLSEFGLQALPDLATLRRFLPLRLLPSEAAPEEKTCPVGELKLPAPHSRSRSANRKPDSSAAVLAHCGVEGELERLLRYHCAQFDKLARYAAPYHPGSLTELIQATQRAQAQGLQVAIEHYRRHRDRTGGILIWQLNEPWPAVSWSIVDYFGTPKLAYRWLKDLYNPVLVSLDYPLRRYNPGDRITADIWVVNDTRRDYPACELTCKQAGREVWSRRLDVPTGGLMLAGRVETTVVGKRELDVTLTFEGDVLSHNFYDLAYHDPAGISTRDRIRNWITWRALEI